MRRSGPLSIQHLALAGLLLALNAAQAEEPYHPVRSDPALEPWRWQIFPEPEGSGLRCLIESRDGKIWCGTDAGVQSYDGQRWTTYAIADGPPEAVNALCACPDGSVYAGTDRGISRFADGAWSRIFPPAGDLPWFVNDLTAATDGAVWAGTGWGALRLGREETLLYTTAGVAAVLRAIAPWVQISTVPDAAVPARPWGEGIGVQVMEGRYLGAPRGASPLVVWALAPGGSGERAGLRIGDRITAVGEQPWMPLEG